MESATRQGGDKPIIEITLKAKAGWVGECSGCGRSVASVHEYVLRRVRDLPILDAQTHVRLERRRLACPECGPKLERLDWLEPYARVTTRLAESVARLCKVLPIKHVATHYGLGWDTVKEIDKAWLERTLGPVDLSGVRQLLMDEFALHTGHRYATVVVEPTTKRVLWVGKGRGREDIRPFFELLGKQGCRAIDAGAGPALAP